METIRFGRTTFLVERIKESDASPLGVNFVLYGPRGRRYLLVRDTCRPDRLVAIAPLTHFSPFRATPFGCTWFAVEGGTLVIAAPDA